MSPIGDKTLADHVRDDQTKRFMALQAAKVREQFAGGNITRYKTAVIVTYLYAQVFAATVWYPIYALSSGARL